MIKNSCLVPALCVLLFFNGCKSKTVSVMLQLRGVEDPSILEKKINYGDIYKDLAFWEYNVERKCWMAKIENIKTGAFAFKYKTIFNDTIVESAQFSRDTTLYFEFAPAYHYVAMLDEDALLRAHKIDIVVLNTEFANAEYIKLTFTKTDGKYSLEGDESILMRDVGIHSINRDVDIIQIKEIVKLEHDLIFAREHPNPKSFTYNNNSWQTIKDVYIKADDIVVYFKDDLGFDDLSPYHHFKRAITAPL